MSFALPPELTLCILSHLPLESLAALQRTGRAWRSFFAGNESSIYRSSVIRHLSLPESTTFDELRGTVSRRAMAGARDWKELRQTQQRTERAWLGQAPSSVTSYPNTGRHVHRIKVDEQRGFVVVTAERAELWQRLRVVDLESGEVLWSLPSEYVTPWAHLEYDDGYIVFNRGGHSSEKEVWRLVPDGSDAATAPDAPPDEAQLRAAAALVPTALRFAPWALLKPPPSESTHAFRFAYPTLIAASESTLYFWDVPSGALVQSIPYSDVGELNYVEVSRQRPDAGGLGLVCGTQALRGYSRALGTCVLDIPSSQHFYADNAYSLSRTEHRWIDDWTRTSVLQPEPTAHRRVSEEEGAGVLWDEFIAVHISECGTHLVALLSSSRLVIVPSFRRIVDGTHTLRQIALDVQLGSPRGAARYLAFDCGRIGVATATGVYVISLDWEHASASYASVDASPTLCVTRAAYFNRGRELSSISCLQFAPTGVYFNWIRLESPQTSKQTHGGETLLPDLGLESTWLHSLKEERSIAQLPDGNNVVQVLANVRVASSSVVVSIDLARTLPVPGDET
ncbi:F-box domain-containing protein [Mycena kentingensis (nom. inval.)]|nr:F-box domain-containing protein [Mycena kentingensis (nom. inval.)]